ncbi:MAG TPA: DegT/DnrJ/EryC1/StrS family aminotransferase [Ilumatobacteraceae bacterium]|nr:DegT/DnrJ/EryC1/StrS family aminotransferase [Ilumatobacteraceae bacterium]
MVPVVDLSRRGQRFASRFAKAAERIAASGSFLMGAELSAFESEFAQWLAAQHCVAVSSGASALQLALAAAGIGPGDEVLVPSFTAVPTASAVAALGAIPRAIDVDPTTACITTDTVAAGRTNRTKAVIIVHLYGYPADLPDTDLLIIEDAAQAHGALRDPGRSAATAYSFYPTKNLGGIGDGGAVVTDRADLAERVRRLRVHGMTSQYVHEDVSQNFRLSEIEAAWLRLALEDLTGDVESRRTIAARYRQAAPHLCWQAAHPMHAYHLAVLRSPDRTEVRAELEAGGVGTAIHYPLAITQQPAYRDLEHASCPISDSWAAECLSVPCFPEMTEAEIDQVGAALARLTQ